jgi:methionine sulfoxide reductase catalytic subunit
MRNPNTTSAHEITDPAIYFNRRSFLRAGILGVSAAVTGLAYRRLNPIGRGKVETPRIQGLTIPSTSDNAAGVRVAEPATSFEDITHYNNFYEFSTDKEGVAPAAAGFETKGWQVSVEGLVRKPRVFDIDDLLKLSPPEERIYRMRCVEAWSMVIPWVGFSLSKLLDRVEPLGDAKYVAFETLLDPKRMPGQRSQVLDWPYVEGLRMDEAMHPLTLLASGLYGRALPPQDGAPIRLVVPWKYGFKGIKSIVKVKVLSTLPRTTWNQQAPNEYVAIHTTGMMALIFLMLTMAVTPVRKFTGWNWLLFSRRVFGLYAFFYACIHFLLFFSLDRSFSLSGTLLEMVKRKYLIVGGTALLVMVPLAITSTNAMIKRLGGRRWRVLHRLAYVAAVAGVIHYYMQVKADVRQPLVFAAVLAILLGYRLLPNRRQSNRRPTETLAPDATRNRESV